MKVIGIEVTSFDQADNEDTVILNLDNGNVWYVQRVDGEFNQMMGCELNKNGKQNPDFDEEAEFVVKSANEA